MAEITPRILKSNEPPSVKFPTNTLSLETISILHKSSLFSKGKQAALVRTFVNHPHHCLPTFQANWHQITSGQQGALIKVTNGLYPEVSPEWKKILSNFKSKHVLTSNGGNKSSFPILCRESLGLEHQFQTWAISPKVMATYPAFYPFSTAEGFSLL